MFEIGDRVRLKETGTFLDVTYEEILEGVVKQQDWDGYKEEYKGRICEVVFKGETKIHGLLYSDASWWIENDKIELVSTKKKRKKKEPIPEGWE